MITPYKVDPWRRGSFNEAEEAKAAAKIAEAKAEAMRQKEARTRKGQPAISEQDAYRIIQLRDAQRGLEVPQVGGEEYEPFHFGNTVHSVRSLGGCRADISGGGLLTIEAAGATDDESKKAFGYTVSGITVTVYRGSILFQDQIFTVATGTVNVTGLRGCVYINLPRTLAAPSIMQTVDNTDGDGVTNDASNWRFPIVSFSGAEGALTLVRRHHMGGNFRLDTPSV